MLDMAFLPDVRRIVEKLSTDRQTLLFSATLPPEIERLAAWVLRNPELVEIGVRRSPAETVTRSEEHTSELQSHSDLVCRLLLEKKKKKEHMMTRKTDTCRNTG